jgi:Fuc2NAc and GlcNAc transferase
MLLIYALSFLLSAAGALLVSRYGLSAGLMDTPGPRSSHRKTTPKGGGIGILASFIFSALILGLSPAVLLPVATLALVSLIGDKSHIEPFMRLLAQVAAASILLAVVSDQLPMPEGYGTLAMGLFAVYIVGTANFFNFMDGIDGMAGMTGMIGFAFFALAANAAGAGLARDMGICISLACLGFLLFNFPRAIVFMGDVGSILLGFAFGAMTLLVSNSLYDVLCISAFILPFYADELSTMAIRLYQGENLLKAHRRHIYQILANQAGMPHWLVTSAYGTIQILIATLVFLLKEHSISIVFFLIGSCFFAFFLFRIHLSSKYESQTSSLR